MTFSPVLSFFRSKTLPSFSSCVPGSGTPGTSPSWLDPDCKDPRTSPDPAGRGHSATFEPWLGIAVLASGSGTILRAMLDARPPDRGRARRPPCGALGIAEAAGVAGRAGRAHHLRRRLRPRRVHPRGASTPSSATTSTCRDGRLRHHPREADPRRVPRPHRQHAPRAAAGVQGLARGRRRARRRREGHRLHRAPRHARGRRRPDPRPGGGAGPRRRHRRDAARAHQGGRAPALSRSAPRSWSNEMRTKITRALLSVYDKTGLVELARGLQRPRRASSCRRAARPRRSPTPASRSPTVDDVTGCPRCSTTGSSRCTRRSTAASSPTAASRRTAPTSSQHGIAAVRPRRVEPLPVRAATPASRPSTSAARRWCAPRRRTTRGSPSSRARRSTTPCSRSCDANDGTVGDDTRRALALEAFAHTAAYDAAIVALARKATSRCRRIIVLALERTDETLRYGENPHQQAARYRIARHHELVGRRRAARRPRALYLNFYDADAAWRLVHDLGDRRRRCAIIKHANPCGVAVADDLATAYQRALECDERSAFGGIVALNRPVDAATVERDGRRPAGRRRDRARATSRARSRRSSHEAQEHPPPRAPARPSRRRLDFRQISRRVPRAGRRTTSPPSRDDWRVVTKRAPTDAEWRDAELAWRICGHVKSNAIVLVKDGQAVGIGAGQQNRVESGEIAAKKAAGRAAGGACASATRSTRSPTASRPRRRRASRWSSSPAARCATRRSSSGPTSSASPWCSPASGTSSTE